MSENCEKCGAPATVQMALWNQTVAYLCAPCWCVDERDVLYGEFGEGE